MRNQVGCDDRCGFRTHDQIPEGHDAHADLTGGVDLPLVPTAFGSDPDTCMAGTFRMAARRHEAASNTTPFFMASIRRRN